MGNRELENRCFVYGSRSDLRVHSVADLSTDSTIMPAGSIHE